MAEQTSDIDLASDVRLKATHLNAAVARAHAAGLSVTLQVAEQQTFATAVPLPHVECIVARPL